MIYMFTLSVLLAVVYDTRSALYQIRGIRVANALLITPLGRACSNTGIVVKRVRFTAPHVAALG